MAFCQNCGKQVDDADLFCSSCGATQPTLERNASATPSSSSDGLEPEVGSIATRQSSSSDLANLSFRPKPIAVRSSATPWVLGLLIVIMAGTGAWLFLTSSGKSMLGEFTQKLETSVIDNEEGAATDVRNIPAGHGAVDDVASRFIPDPFKPQAALALLFGELDAKGGAVWKPIDPADGPEGHGVMRVSLRRSGSFTNRGERWSYILTGSESLECEAFGCGPGAVGGALFKYVDGKWVLASHDPSITYSGSYGAVGEDIHSLRKDGNVPLIRVDSGNCHQGRCEQSTSLLAVVDNQWAIVWSSDTAASNTECEESPRCSNWESHIKTLPANSTLLPEIEVVTAGRLWDEDKDRLLELNQTDVYRFDSSGKYRQISRSGTPAEVPLHVASAGDAQANSPSMNTTDEVDTLGRVDFEDSPIETEAPADVYK